MRLVSPNKTTQNDHEKYLQSQDPNNVISALRQMDIKVMVKPVGVNKTAAEEIKKYIKDNKCTQVALQVVRQCAAGVKRQPFNALSYITEDKYCIGKGVLRCTNTQIDYTNGVTISVQSILDNYHKKKAEESSQGKTVTQEVLAGNAEFMMAKMGGSTINVTNNVREEVVHKDTTLAIPSTMPTFFELVKKNLGTIKHDTVSDLVLEAMKASKQEDKRAIFANYLKEIPKVGDKTAVTMKKKSKNLEGKEVKTLVLNQMEVGTRNINPQPSVLRAVESKMANALPPKGLGGRPVLNYYGVPVGNNDKPIYQLTLLNDSKIHKECTIISTDTNSTTAMFMRANGYENFYATAENHTTASSMFVSSFCKLDGDKFVFHPEPIRLSGKKGNERAESVAKLNEILDKYKINENALIYVTTVSFLSAGGRSATALDVADEKQDATLYPFERDPQFWKPRPYKQEKSEIPPARYLSRNELKGTYAQADTSICTVTGPFVLVSDFLDAQWIGTLADKVLRMINQTCVYSYGIGHVYDGTLDVKLISKAPMEDIDYAEVGNYSQKVIQQLYYKASKSTNVSKPLVTDEQSYEDDESEESDEDEDSNYGSDDQDSYDESGDDQNTELASAQSEDGDGEASMEEKPPSKGPLKIGPTDTAKEKPRRTGEAKRAKPKRKEREKAVFDVDDLGDITI